MSLARLLEQATPPEALLALDDPRWWESDRKGLLEEIDGHHNAKRTLGTLAPDMARLLIDMAAKLADHVAHCEFCGGDGWEYARGIDGERRVRCRECDWAMALLARFAALDKQAGG